MQKTQVGTQKILTSHEERKISESGQALKQISQRCSEISFFGDTQGSTGDSPEQSVVNGPALGMMWD